VDPARERFTLGEWIVDAAGNRLLRGDEQRPLRHKAMALLVLLARHAGETVSRDEIVNTIWDGNQFVAPKAINTAIWTIRQALGDDPEAPRYVETVAKKGYRLIAPVGALAVAAEPAPAAALARRPWLPVLATVLISSALAWAWLQRTPPPLQAALPTATPLTQNPGLEYLGQLSPDGRHLAFAWWQGHGAGQLYLRAAQDLNATPQPISGEAGEVQGLAWSPDGQAVAYIASPGGGRCSLWVYRLQDQTRHELARCAPMFTPTVDWSPDGRWIAFSAEAEGAGGLFLIAPDGSGLRRLTTAPPAAMPDHQPAWSPDGRHLAFARQDPANGTRDMYEVALDGPVQRLSNLQLYWLHGLTYTPGGRDLVFSTTRQDTRVLLRWDRASATAQPLGLEGSAPKRGADGILVYALMRAHVSIARLAWGDGKPERRITSVANDRAPDVAGDAAVFVSRRSGQSELWQTDGSAGEARQLTRLDGVAAAPALAPDGGQVAFLGSCGPGKRFGLCVLGTADGRVRPLSADAAGYGRPSWHPSANEVWVPSDRGGSWQLWRFAADGSRPPAVVPTEAPPGRAVQWAADGSALVYQPRFSGQLRRRTTDGSEQEIATTADGETLVDWRLGPRGLVVLARGSRERFRLIALAGGRQEQLSVHALGTFPELASFALADDGSALVEISNTAGADLMQMR